MTRIKIDWPQHVAAFRASSHSIAAYCAAAQIKADTFRYHLYKSKTKRQPAPKFAEFTVAPELIITRDQRGTLAISGVDAAHLPKLVGAWFNALSH